jgi:PAS domain S-box-containing protein
MKQPVAEPETRDVVDARLRELIRESPFPLFLVQLSDSALLETSRPLEVWAGRDRSELVGMRTLDFVNDPESARRSMSLLASGVIDAYTRMSVYRRPDGTLLEFEVRFAAYVDEVPRRTAVAMILASSDQPTAETLEQPEIPGSVLVLGTVDMRWTIDRITSDVSALLGYEAETLLGKTAFELIHPEDVSSLLLMAAHSGERAGGACGRIRVRTAAGEWIVGRIVVQPLAGATSPAFAFALSSITTAHRFDEDRARELEDHLRRIAREIAASGVAAWSTRMPTAAELPEISQLTSREYEIVVRLATGERVPGIARALFLSESTVRNHLTSVYRKFGVHSQNDLMSRLHSIA